MQRLLISVAGNLLHHGLGDDAGETGPTRSVAMKFVFRPRLALKS
jgi:hypothetical protein